MSETTPGEGVPRDEFVRGMFGEEAYSERRPVAIAGLVGDSPRAGHLRLYTNPNLSECLEIPEDAVLSQRPLDRTESPIGGSSLWVDGSTKLLRVTVDSVDAESAFLQGDMVDEEFSRVAASGLIGDVNAGLLSTPVCTIIVTIATVTLAVCTRNKTCPKTCKNCPFTHQQGCKHVA